MNDPVAWILRMLMMAAAAMNIWSCVRCYHISNKYDPNRAFDACIQDDKGEIFFAKWMTIHHPYERVEHTDLLRMYKRWRDERDLPITTRLVNDGILLDMMLSSLDNTEDTPT